MQPRQSTKKELKRIDFQEHKKHIFDFLRDYEVEDEDVEMSGSQDNKIRKKYYNYLMEYADNRRVEIPVEIDDLYDWAERNPEFPQDLPEAVVRNTVRYVKLFADAAIMEGMPERDLETGNPGDAVLKSRRLVQESSTDPHAVQEPRNRIPKELQRNFQVVFIPPSRNPVQKIRLVNAAQIGGLITVRGIVTRITEVRPFIQVASYVCSKCGCEIYQEVRSRSYKPLTECTTPSCVAIKNKSPLEFVTRSSKFTKFQEMKLQELPEEVPEGNVPRSLTVYLFGEQSRSAQCGDKVTVAGIWLPLPKTGFRALKSGLCTTPYLHCTHITKEKKGYDTQTHSPEIMEEVEDAVTDPNIYTKLAKSLAPEFYGMEDIKKALLLLMVAGVSKNLADGLKIRGDINVLLMGDPGVAKSQLLRAVCRIAPRTVYTTGQGSSGVGLTAAVMRDKITKDMVLEAGALVLADMGICCIDEFDKMEESDRTAIHEVMEQQTVSIAKAGVTTSLNARTAVLAAANPAFGRYNKNKSAQQNINLPAALLSRFDVLWVIVDRSDHDRDLSLAQHICYVHQHDTFPEMEFQAYSADFLRAYIARARQFEPTIPKELTEYIVMSYVQVRQSSLTEDGQYDSRKIIGTPRALLSILRLGQALARLRFSNTVNQGDVEEAMRIMTEAKRSSLAEEEEFAEFTDMKTRIYTDVRDWLRVKDESRGKMADLMELLQGKYEDEKIRECLEDYQELDVFYINTAGTYIQLVET